MVTQQDSERLYRALVDRMPGAAVFVVDRDLRYRTAAGEALADAGFSEADFLGKRLDEALPPSLAAEYEPNYRAALAGTPFDIEHAAHGHVYRSRGVPLRDDAGAVFAVLVVSHDITGQRRLESELRANERTLGEIATRYRSIFETVDVAVWEEDMSEAAERLQALRASGVTDLAEHLAARPELVLGICATIRLLDGNRRALTMFEADSKAALLQDISQFFDPTTADLTVRFLMALAQGEQSFTSETRYRTLKGRIFPARFSMSVAPTARPYQRVLVVIDDLTDQKRAEAELHHYMSELRAQDQRKDEFLATLAHELRNPLAPIRTGLALLRRTDAEPSVTARTVDMMSRQLTHLVRLVDDLLDVGRISTGRVELRMQPLDLADLLVGALEAARPTMETRGLQVEVSLDGAPRWVVGDRDRLNQVFSNLLTNAVKFTPAGGTVGLRLVHEPDAAVVTVEDSGIGIPADALPRVFDQFSQVRRQQSAGTGGGLGLGLSIVKRLVEMHDGKVEAFSAGEGRGSSFTVRLPVGDAVDAAPSPAAASEPPPVRPAPLADILIVDDNVDAAESLSTLLACLGHRTRCVHSGADAVAQFTQSAPDVVLLDLGMPGMDGFETARRLRALDSRAKLIALSGWGQTSDRERTTAAGFTAHLVKPVDAAELLSVINTVLAS